MNQNFYMLIGVPGSGKSTVSKKLCEFERESNNSNVIIISTDEYREKLFNNVNDTKNNPQLFKIVNQDIIKYLQNGYSVIYDACNINIKSRREILNRINSLKLNIEIVANVVYAPIEIVKERNFNRERKVPEDVIERMLRNFQLPILNEGFTKIKFIENYKGNKLSIFDEFVKMKNFEQKNPHHSNTLDEHCYKACSYLLNKTKNKELLIATLFHDIGKLYTQSYNEEKQFCQYIGHEGYGAYLSLLFNDSELGKFNGKQVAYYINYHMIPFAMDKMKDSKKEHYKYLLKNLYDDILLLHEADLQAH